MLKKNIPHIKLNYKIETMQNDLNTLPAADQPNWGEKYNWEWFKYHHFTMLEKNYFLVSNQYKNKKSGERIQMKK